MGFFCRVGLLSPLPTDAAGQLDVFVHDGDPLGMDGRQVGVLKDSQPGRPLPPPRGPARRWIGSAGRSSSPGRSRAPSAGRAACGCAAPWISGTCGFHVGRRVRVGTPVGWGVQEMGLRWGPGCSGCSCIMTFEHAVELSFSPNHIYTVCNISTMGAAGAARPPGSGPISTLSLP